MECEVCKNVVTDVQALDRDPTTQVRVISTYIGDR